MGTSRDSFRIGNLGKRVKYAPVGEIRREAGESIFHWIKRVNEILTQLDEEATEFEQRLRVLESIFRFIERLGKVSGLERPESTDGAGTIVEIVYRDFETGHETEPDIIT